MLAEVKRNESQYDAPPPEPTLRDEVIADLHGTVSPTLRNPDRVEEWYETLLDIRGEIDIGLAAVRSTLATNRAGFTTLHQACLKRGEEGRTAWQVHKREWSEADAQAERDKQQLMELKAKVDRASRSAKSLRSTTRTDRYADTLLRERDDARTRVIELEHGIETWADHQCNDDCNDGCTGDAALAKLLNP